MRRYDTKSNNVNVVGPSAKVKLGLTPIIVTPVVEEVEPVVIPEPVVCTPDPTIAAWWDSEEESFSLESVSGLIDKFTDNVSVTNDYILTKPPYNFHARLLGELCLAEHYVDWDISWEDVEGSTNLPPMHNTSGPDIFFGPRDDNQDGEGVFTVVAMLKKGDDVIYESDEIYLTISSSTYYTYINVVEEGFPPNTWVGLHETGSTVTIDGEPPYVYNLDNGFINIGYNNEVVFNFDPPIQCTHIWVYSNDGGSGYYSFNSSPEVYFQRGALHLPSSLYGDGVINVEGYLGTGNNTISYIRLTSDGYGSDMLVKVYNQT